MGIEQRKISVFIDASNLHHCQLVNGWRIDFRALRNYFDSFGEVVGLYYFTPSPSYEEQEKVEKYRRFKNVLISFGYTVIDKEVKKIRSKDRETGEVIVETKGNLDGEIVLFILTTYDRYDEMIFVGGDSDFAMVVDYMVKNKKLVTCVSNTKSTSIEIRNIAHKFIDLNSVRDVIEDKYKKPV